MLDIRALQRNLRLGVSQQILRGYQGNHQIAIGPNPENEVEWVYFVTSATPHDFATEVEVEGCKVKVIHEKEQ